MEFLLLTNLYLDCFNIKKIKRTFYYFFIKIEKFLLYTPFLLLFLNNNKKNIIKRIYNKNKYLKKKVH